MFVTKGGSVRSQIYMRIYTDMEERTMSWAYKRKEDLLYMRQDENIWIN